MFCAWLNSYKYFIFDRKRFGMNFNDNKCKYYVTVQTGLRIYCADRTKVYVLRAYGHRAAIFNGHMRNSSAFLNCYNVTDTERNMPDENKYGLFKN